MNIIVNQSHISAAQQVKIDAWIADPSLWHDEILKPERDKRLEFYDYYQLYNPWNELTAGEQTEFQTWRTAILAIDVTYPTYTALDDITWPAACSFFEAYPG